MATDERGGVDGGFVDLDGRRFYRIGGYDRIRAFFMTIVGGSDVWAFISSTGGLTAGRVDRDHALFPYATVDKVTDAASTTGGLSMLWVDDPDGARTWWQPFADLRPTDPPVERALYKDALGTTLVFEEHRPDLGLRLRVAWQTSGRFGVVRTCELTTTAQAPREIELLDGFVNLLPPGIDYGLQNQLSVLIDAYKRSEVDAATGLGLAYLNSGVTDQAEPSESLQTTVAWQVGLADPTHLLSTRQLTTFVDGAAVAPESDVRGERGAYLVRCRVAVGAGDTVRWRVVADVDHDAADVVALRAALRRPERIAAELDEDLARSRDTVERFVTAADGRQQTGDEMATTHHRANVLFNVMRGGVPVDGYRVDADDVRAFMVQRSTATARRRGDILDALPDTLRYDELVAICADTDDVDLERLAREYLPLTFSRRHGDPSRPWNRFRIVLRDEAGDPLLTYEGNWRDIFQNWEALAWSFPEYVEGMATVFLDATTVDGYNPYRITRAGIDWEIPDPDDPWSNIGYWSDHQIIYLLKLLETSERFHPGRLRADVNRAVYVHADVPYRIASYADTLNDPYETITFDEDHHTAVAERVAAEGADGRLVHRADGDLVRVTLAEKLLLLLLAKLVNLVPDGGIWMNTQRPEWNDANNALVGRGLSVVTLSYLCRYVAFVRDLLDVDVDLSAGLRDLLVAVTETLATHADALDDGFDAQRRRAVMDALGAAGTAYRAQVYAGDGDGQVTVRVGEVTRLLDVAQRYVDAGVRANRRDDGLYHAYNLLDLDGDGARIRRLEAMLEGQVAVLSSGLLGPDAALDLLRSLRTSGLYRADQHSYMLYPDRDLPSFLERTAIDPARAADVPLVHALVAAGDRSIVVGDVEGGYHFAARVHNARDVAAALDDLVDDPSLGELVRRDRSALLDLFEDTFDHAAFTGRSGSFFAFEGLGSIYWHMVSKLLLAVQETLGRAVADGEDVAVVDALIDAYEDVRHGLGYTKSPEVYGAFPADPYSHSPAGHGARQPGMTGQVKEEVLTRLGELGLRVEDGRVVVRPVQLRDDEWTTGPTTFAYRDVFGRDHELDLPAGALAFTFCQVPVVYERGDALRVVAHLADGGVVDARQGRLDADLSGNIFRRDGKVASLRVHVPGR